MRMKMPSFSLKEMFEIKIITLYGRSFVYLNYVCWGREGLLSAMPLETRRGCQLSRVLGDCELHNVDARN